MDYRKFWLENNEGNLFYMTEKKNKWFLDNPQGLGLTVDYSSIKLANSELINYKDYILGNVQGDLLFFADENSQIYEDYFSFLRFISKYPIYLHYMPPNNNQSYRSLVQITGLNKSQISKDGILHCPISMKLQTLWYGDDLNVIEVTNTVADGKHYKLERPYSYGAISFHNIVMYNNGMLDAPFTLDIEGKVTDITYTLSQFGETYGRGKILGTYDRIFVDSDDLNEKIELYQGDSNIPNAVNYQDLTVGSANEIFVTFLKLKPGISTLNVAVPDQYAGKITTTWRNAYLSV